MQRRRTPNFSNGSAIDKEPPVVKDASPDPNMDWLQLSNQFQSHFYYGQFIELLDCNKQNMTSTLSRTKPFVILSPHFQKYLKGYPNHITDRYRLHITVINASLINNR